MVRKKSLGEMKDFVRHVRKTQTGMGTGDLNKGKDAYENLAYQIVKADDCIRGGHNYAAMQTLFDAAYNAQTSPIKAYGSKERNLTPEQHAELIRGIEKRAERVLRDAIKTGDRNLGHIEAEMSYVGNYLGHAKQHLKEDGGKPYEYYTSKRRRLTSTTATASIIGIVGGLFFLSSNITGNAIANVSQSSGNILGTVLLVVGLVAGFFWVKKK